MKLLPIILAAGLLAGCQSTSIDSQVAGAEVALTGSENAALLYTRLPRCNDSTPICSTQPAVDAIKSADNTAYNALVAARNNTGTIDAALTAINTLSGLIPATGQPPAAAVANPHFALQRS